MDKLFGDGCPDDVALRTRAIRVMLAEVFPLFIRGFAIGIAVFRGWIANAK